MKVEEPVRRACPACQDGRDHAERVLHWQWNPIEHQLFGPINLNWAGQPLRDWETVLGYIGATTTTTGLQSEPSY